jgi:hypothetical protein
MLAVTLDIDWAPDPIVDAVMELCEKRRVPVTLFCTNPDTDRSGNSSNLRGRYDERHELALHPYFSDFADHEAVLRDLLAHYPNAQGFQSHNGNTGWPIWSAAFRRGLKYEVDCRVFPVDVPPFVLDDPKGSCVFVSRFMDANLLHQAHECWSMDHLPLTHEAMSGTSLFVIKFHPNIIYYDMRSTGEYKKHKSYYHEPRERLSFRRNVPRGAAKLLIDLLSSVEPDYFTTISDFGRSLGIFPAIDWRGGAPLIDPRIQIRGSKIASAGVDIVARRTAAKKKTFQ